MMFLSSEVDRDRISFIQDVRILCWCPVKTVIKCGENTSLALPGILSSDFLTNKYPCELYVRGWRSARLVSLYCKNVSESIHGSNDSQIELKTKKMQYTKFMCEFCGLPTDDEYSLHHYFCDALLF